MLPVEHTKNKCGSGQPPKPHCCRGCFRLPSSARDGRSSPSGRSEERHAAMPSEALASGFEIQRFHPALEEDRRRPQCLGSGSLEMNRTPRRFTLERIASNTESLAGSAQKHSRAWLRTLCRTPASQRNGKLGRRCAKGVEGSKFLWKGKEKRSFRRSPRPFVVVPRMSRCSTLMSRWPPRPNHSRQLAGP
jgi:hypothetical protein